MSKQPAECCCCGFETEALTDYGYRSDDPKWCCDLCASTMASRAHEHPDQFRGQEHVLKAVCYVGNTILAAIKALRVSEVCSGE
jgi:hypothetical protein